MHPSQGQDDFGLRAAGILLSHGYLAPDSTVLAYRPKGCVARPLQESGCRVTGWAPDPAELESLAHLEPLISALVGQLPETAIFEGAICFCRLANAEQAQRVAATIAPHVAGRGSFTFTLREPLAPKSYREHWERLAPVAQLENCWHLTRLAIAP